MVLSRLFYARAWSDWEVDLEATSRTDGIKHRTCMRCGEVETYAIPSDHHEHTMKKHVVQPTCTEQGYTEYRCVNKAGLPCGEHYIVEGSRTPALGHDYSGDSGIRTIVEPTCTTPGLKEYNCSRCGDTYTEIVPQLGHNYELKPENSKEPDCTQPGTEYYVCGRCGDVHLVRIPAKGHDWGDWIIDRQETDQEDGAKHRVCKVCGERQDAKIPKLSHVHNHIPTVVEPTCEQQGYTRYTCACGDTYIEESSYVPALGHAWVETGRQEPTSKTVGVITYTCQRCAKLRYEFIPKTEPVDTWKNPYRDVRSNAWYYEDVAYVTRGGLMVGTSTLTFSPAEEMSRAMLVAVLYRMSGSPSVAGMTAPFTDVPDGQWYTEAVEVADVTDTARMRMFNKGRKVVDLAREFIDSAGAKHYAEAMIGEVENRDPFAREVVGATFAERFEENLRDNNVVSQRGLIEMFDSTIGRSTVLMPFGGRTQGSETQVSVQKLPTDGYTDTASIMAFGYNPYLASWSPYHGAAYAVVEAAAKVVAAGARYDRMRYSYQEYFERMTRDPRSWGKPLGALLGALKMQVELGLPSIGGKDSMSGTFQHINVPPMLMAFGITTVNAGTVISTDFKKAGNRIYLVRHTPRENHMPDTAQLKDNFGFVSENIERGNILAAWSVGFGGVAEGLAKMAFGNRIGAEVEMDEAELFGYAYGSILVESAVELTHPAAGLLGMTAAEGALTVNGVKMPLDALYKANTEKFAAVYPDKGENHAGVMTSEPAPRTFAYRGEAVEHPLVYIPVFPGTNCDYDTAKAFRKAGAEVEMSVLCNLGGDDILRSIREMKEHIRRAHIFVLSGGFSSGDEPDGSAKFIVNVLNNKDIRDEIHALLDRGGLILGICNGFQALIKLGLVPYGEIRPQTADSPTLTYNTIGRHISKMVYTKVVTNKSPWLAQAKTGEVYCNPASHGEGRFVAPKEWLEKLFANGQVATQYVNEAGVPTMDEEWNVNGSYMAIEGITSPDGRVLGKMAHSERRDRSVAMNIYGEQDLRLFESGVEYFK